VPRPVSGTLITRESTLVKINQRTIQLGMLVTCLLTVTAGAAAQSTVFNIPSSDVLEPRKVYVEAEFITHFASYQNGGYQTYGPHVVAGLPGNTEVGINAFYTRASPAEPVTIEPNFKWQFYNNEKIGVALAAGVLISIPVTHRRSANTTGMVYLVGSKSFEASHAPRLTFGGYRLVGRFDDGTDKTGVLAGYEQPITKRLSFLVDWFSGNNDLGYVTAGTGLTLSPRDSVYAGYSFGNQGRGNNSLGIYYGRTF
jgi:hypothetical protein